MAKVINCECGQAVRAETDDELVASVEERAPRPPGAGRADVARGHPRDGGGRLAIAEAADDAVPAGALGSVEGLVGAAQQSIGVLFTVPARDADRARLIPGGLLTKAFEQGQRGVQRAVGEGYGELLPAVTRQDIGDA